jgi:hypothetical protein
MKFSTRKTPSILACAAILISGFHAPLHAAVISIISSSVTVQSKAGQNSYSGTINGNSNSASITGINGPQGDLSEWEALSSGSITTTGAALSAVSRLINGSGNSVFNSGYSQVSLTSDFQPLTPNITFILSGSTGFQPNESYIDYSLTDLTVNGPIQSRRWAQDRGEWGNFGLDSLPYSSNLLLNTSHLYRLQLLTRSTNGDARQGYANLNLQIVPEPASAALVIIGFAGMIFRRTRTISL